MHIIRIAAVALAALLAVHPVLAHDTASPSTAHAAGAIATLGALELSGGFTRATLPNAPVGGGYLTITNTGPQPDRLIAAASPVAGVMQIHEMKMEGDVMKMAELPDGLEIPAGQTVTLSPGGFHLMFMQLKQPLVEGTTVPVTLTFEKAGTIEIALPVEGVAAKGAAGDHAMHGDAAAHGHGTGMAPAPVGLSDEDAIAHMQKQMFDTPENPLTMGPIVVVGDYAVSDWAQGDTGGRALLRKTEKGWGIHLCAGDGLKQAAELEKIGVPAGIAAELAAKLAAVEGGVDPALLAKFAAFDGVMMVDESLI